MAKKEQKHTRLSVDNGWAWLVALGMASWNFAIGGTIKCSGLFFTEFIELFGESLQLTSWVGASVTLTNLVTSPLAGYMYDKSSHTVIRCIIGLVATVSSISMLAAAWSKNVTQVIILFGVIPGLGSAVLDVFVLSSVGLYFKKCRFLASAIASNGGSTGGIVLPHLVTLMLQAYGVRGAIALMAGVWLQILVVAFIMRPLTRHDKEYLAIGENAVEKTLADHENLQIQEDLEQVYAIDDDNATLDSSKLELGAKHNHPGKCSDETVFDSTDELAASNTLIANENNHENQFDDSSQTNKTSVDSNELDMMKESNSKQKSCCSSMKDYFIFLCSPGLPSVCVTFTLSVGAYYTQFFLIPPLLRDIGINQSFATRVISVWCISELCSRFVIGYIVDRYPHRKIQLLCIEFIISGAAGFIVSMLTSKWVFMAYAVVLGSIGGSHTALIVPMLIERVPSRWKGSAVALYALITGIGITCGPPIVSLLKTYTGTYSSGLYFLSSCFIAASAVLLMVCCQKSMPCRGKSKKKHIAEKMPLGT